MNGRERIQAAIGYQAPDRLPCNESFWDETLAAWRQQGMPAADPMEFFDFDLATMYLDASPRYEQRILADAGGYLVFEDRFGYTARKSTQTAGSIAFLKHVTTDRASWADVARRLTISPDPAEPARIDTASYFEHFDPYPTWGQARGQCDHLRSGGRYVLFRAYGPWNATWRHRGFDRLLLDILTDPEWVAEMTDTYHGLVIDILDRCLQEGLRPDGYYMVEDLAHTRSMMFDPGLWRAWIKPSVARLGQWLKANGIDFWMHSDGNLEPLFEDLIECGVRVLNPLQVSAGFHVADLTRRYRGRLAFYGNISAVNMAGPWPVLAEEIRDKVCVASQGGYIFHSDHSVTPDVGFERYRQLLEYARQCFA